MTSQTGKQIITISIFPNISRSNGKQGVKCGQLIEFNLRNIFLQKSCRKSGREISSGVFLFFKKVLNEVKASDRSSLENCTSSNTKQQPITRHSTRQHEYNTRPHETTQVQHGTTRVQHDTTRDNTSATRDNTSASRGNTSATRDNTITKQHTIYFDSVYVVKPRKLKIAFSSKSQNRTRKSQGSGFLQLCFCLSVY